MLSSSSGLCFFYRIGYDLLEGFCVQYNTVVNSLFGIVHIKILSSLNLLGACRGYFPEHIPCVGDFMGDQSENDHVSDTVRGADNSGRAHTAPGGV